MESTPRTATPRHNCRDGALGLVAEKAGPESKGSPLVVRQVENGSGRRLGAVPDWLAELRRETGELFRVNDVFKAAAHLFGAEFLRSRPHPPSLICRKLAPVLVTAKAVAGGFEHTHRTAGPDLLGSGHGVGVLPDRVRPVAVGTHLEEQGPMG